MITKKQANKYIEELKVTISKFDCKNNARLSVIQSYINATPTEDKVRLFKDLMASVIPECARDSQWQSDYKEMLEYLQSPIKQAITQPITLETIEEDIEWLVIEASGYPSKETQEIAKEKGTSIKQHIQMQQEHIKELEVLINEPSV